MKEIKMSYVFVKKDVGDKTMKQILIEYLEQTGYPREGTTFLIDESQFVDYEIGYQRKSFRCYLSLKTNSNRNRGLKILQQFDDKIFRSDLAKYMEPLRVFDGISFELTNKLYPKYAMYERLLRGFILLVLTKAYGAAWRNETVSQEELKILSEKAKAKGNLLLTDTLEQFDVKQLEDYLFKPREENYKDYLEKELASKRLKELSKEEICDIIDAMRPKSLWERNFEEFGTLDEWKTNIVQVNKCRNTIAHNKRISLSESVEYTKKLNRANSVLKKTIAGIQEQEFSDISIVDVLSSFILLISNVLSNQSKYDFTPLFNELRTVADRINLNSKFKAKPEIISTFSMMSEASQNVSREMELLRTRIAQAFEETNKYYNIIHEKEIESSAMD